MKSPFILFIVVALASIEGRAQKYSPDLLREDFQLLRDTLQKIHPSLYRYSSKEVIDGSFDYCAASIRDSMTLFNFYAMTCFVISRIEDGHTFCLPPEGSVNDLEKHTPMFPLRLRFIGDKAYVVCGKGAFHAGTELISIDGLPADQVLQNLFLCLPSDGVIQTGKLHNLNDEDETFPFLYYSMFGSKATFTIEFRADDSSIQKTDLPADYLRNMRCDKDVGKSKGLTLEFGPDGVAILTIGTFETKEEKFKAFLQRSFDEINRKGAKALIIDLRNNGGGRDLNGAALYAHLTSRPFKYYDSLQTVSHIFTPAQHPNLLVQQPDSHPFTGKVYFLINGSSFSATAEFCAVARSESRGIFVGEETGGGYYGNTSGRDVEVILPHTKIHVSIPLVKYTMAVKPALYPDRGIIPDYPVIPTFDDVARQKDVQLAFALNLAAQ